MSFRIAVAGKGGVGKSTLAALLVRALHDRSKKIIMAVDADPNSNLGEKLGVKVEKTIGDLREELLKKADELPAGQSKQEYVRYQMQLALMEGEGFDLLTMGRPEGQGCYCYINNILRTFLDMAMDDYEYVVIDNEAGMEHLSRRTTKSMDVLLLVSDPTKVGLETARRLLDLSKAMEIKVGTSLLIVNRAKKPLDPGLDELICSAGFDRVELVPQDPEVERAASMGQSLIGIAPENAVLKRVGEIAWLLV
ncbi:MAG: AAA family ATPase [Methanomassiliicoccales archaeon]|nr:AAA family ATPase [Methanomassiliicoccales archaeon]